MADPELGGPAMARTATTSSTESFWLAGRGGAMYGALRDGVTADVVVVGGGIAGVTTALRLQREGVRVVLLEAVAIGSGVTGNTSAKVSALQGTTLSAIASRHRSDVADVYAAATAAAVADVATLAAEEQIDCDLDRRPAVTYAASTGDLDALTDEFDAMTAAGLPIQWRDEDARQPYRVSGAIWLHDQIAFQPVEYVRGLTMAFVRDGGRIYDNSRVLSVKTGSPCEVRTPEGVVRAGQVVIATHYPILDRGLLFTRLEAQRSYCIAAAIRGPAPATMAISADSPTRSIQFTGDTVIVGGEGHAAGQANVGTERFRSFGAIRRRALGCDRDRRSLVGPGSGAPRPSADDRSAPPPVKDTVGRDRVGEMGPHRRHLRRAHPHRGDPRPRARVGADPHAKPADNRGDAEDRRARPGRDLARVGSAAGAVAGWGPPRPRRY